MKARKLAILCFSICLFAAASVSVYAQARTPGGPPPGPPPGAPGGPGGPGGSGGFGGPPSGGAKTPNGSARARASGGVQFGPVGRWWDDKSTAKTVGLSTDQKKKMDAIFDENKPAILAAYRDFLKEQSALAVINKDPNADKANTFTAIDAVNRARAGLEKATAQMYLEIRHQMSADQIDRVEKLQ